jgi:tetratricopeptide (TPR) repeat protein
LTRSLDWSYHLLGKRVGESAQAIFATCGFFAGSFDEPTVATVAGVSKARKDLNRLLDASLIRREADDGSMRYRLHRFTRDYALRRLAESPAAEETQRRFVAHYARLVKENAPDPNDIGRYVVLDKEWRNAIAASKVAESRLDTSSLLSMLPLGHFFQFRGLWTEAAFLYLRILAIVRSTSDKKNEGAVLNNMGVVYQAQGRYDQALVAYDQALAIRREFQDRVGEGKTLNNMGIVYRNQGRYDQALDAYDQALAIMREFQDRVGEGQTLGNMGVLHQIQGRYDQALDAYAQALAIMREFRDRVGEGRTLGGMGIVYKAQGRYDQALDAYAQALAICREFKDQVVEGRTLENLALLSEVQNNLHDAIEWARQAVAVLETTQATAALEKARRTLNRLEKA